MKMRHIIIFALLIITGCSGTTSKVTYKHQSFMPSGVEIAVMPPRYVQDHYGGSGVDVANQRNIIPNTLTILNNRTSTVWLSPSESAARLQNDSLISLYDNFLSTYQRTGIAKEQVMVDLNKELNVLYIALLEFDHRVSPVADRSNYRTVSAVITIYDTMAGLKAYEATANASCGSGVYDSGLESLARDCIMTIAEQFPSGLKFH